jgi:hypothetical protein
MALAQETKQRMTSGIQGLRHEVLMSRVFKGFLLVALAVGCSTANTGEMPEGPTTPTPPGTEERYNPETYAKALRSASIKLRSKLPASADLMAILDADPKTGEARELYESLVDEYLDPAQNADLDETLWEMYKGMFIMGDKKATIGAATVNYNEPANLATYVTMNNRPRTAIITADYCVTDTTGANGQLPVGGQLALSEAQCTGGTPVEGRAGIATNQAFLQTFGAAGTVQFMRVSVFHQLTSCGIYPDSTEKQQADGGQGWNRTNNMPANGDPLTVAAANDPADPPRVHKKYQAVMAGQDIPCANCHHTVNPRRNAFAKFDVDGAYQADFTILNTESPDQNTGICYAIPDGFTDPYGNGGTPGGQALTECCNPNDPNDCISQEDAMAGPGGCCWDPVFTDDLARDFMDCSDSTQPWCGGYFKNEPISHPRDLADKILDTNLNGTTFSDCQVNRFYNFTLGLDPGYLGLQAADGARPVHPGDAIISKYRSLFERDYNVLNLLRATFKGDEYLSSQAQ